jgi:hypothetical protein
MGRTKEKAMKSRYYIGTGAKNCYFTLRQEIEEPTYSKSEQGVCCTGTKTSDFHVRNLSIDREEAIRKAHEITGIEMTTDIEVRPIGERNDIDWSVFRGGKYNDKALVDVVLEDKDYCVWYAESMANKTAELLRILLAHELEEKRSKEDAARKALEDVELRKKNSNFVGNVGERITVPVTVVDVFCGSGRFGAFTVTKMEDANGNRLVYWKELYRKDDEPVEIGDALTVTGTVKTHGVGRDQWMVEGQCGSVKETTLAKASVV